jgi:hypothetical protein
MANTQLTIELLRQFAQLLSSKRENFEQIKGTMDNTLQSFLWDDPVAYKFKTDYEEKLQPLKEKLFPAMVKYEDYLRNLAGLSDVYTENSSPSSLDFKTTTTVAAVADSGSALAATAVVASLYRGNNYSNALKGVDLSPKNWGCKTKQQKIDELQILENNIAATQKRSPATINPTHYDNDADMGDYNGATNTININEKLLDGDYDYNKLKKVVNTVAHEGRHDCQYEASMTSNSTAVCGTVDERKEWKKEFSDMTNQYAQTGKTLKKCNFEYTEKGEIDWEKSEIKVFDEVMQKSGSACDWQDYRFGNAIENDAWNFGYWFEKQFEQKFPERPRRIKK